jgi:hypothetical protein
VADTSSIPGKIRLLTLDHLDGRTEAARRARELLAESISDLGGPDVVSAGEVRLATSTAMLDIVVESFNAELLAGECPTFAGKPISVSDWYAGHNCQRRAHEALGLRRRPREDPAIVELMARAANEKAEQAA